MKLRGKEGVSGWGERETDGESHTFEYCQHESSVPGILHPPRLRGTHRSTKYISTTTASQSNKAAELFIPSRVVNILSSKFTDEKS